MTDMGLGSTTLTPYTVMAEEHPPSPEREDETFCSGDCGSSPQ